MAYFVIKWLTLCSKIYWYFLPSCVLFCSKIDCIVFDGKKSSADSHPLLCNIKPIMLCTHWLRHCYEVICFTIFNTNCRQILCTSCTTVHFVHYTSNVCHYTSCSKLLWKIIHKFAIKNIKKCWDWKLVNLWRSKCLYVVYLWIAVMHVMFAWWTYCYLRSHSPFVCISHS